MIATRTGQQAKRRRTDGNAESFESVVRFYRDALGAEETTRHQVAGADVVRLKVGRTGLGVFNYDPCGNRIELSTDPA